MPVVLVLNMDANLEHDILPGGTVTRIIRFCNQNLVDWFSKWQACVQAKTLGSKFVTARCSFNTIAEMLSTLR
jgi:predicted  nucleic acid-binding Zn ribbon protein